MCMDAPPAPPDPKETSAAQTGTNVTTAIANNQMGQVNQYGPDGSSLEYNQRGTEQFTDPYTGNTYDIPTYSATQKLGEKAQNIFDTGQDTQLNLAQMGRDQSGFVKDYLSKPFNPDTSEIEGRLFDLASNRILPQQAINNENLRTRLSNQGIKAGTEAYDREMGGLYAGQSDQMNQLALQGRSQALSELTGIRNQPLNEINALMSGSQVSMPNYGIAQPSQIPTTDNAGLINQHYAQQQQNWAQESASKGGMFGGLAQLGGTLGGYGILAKGIG